MGDYIQLYFAFHNVFDFSIHFDLTFYILGHSVYMVHVVYILHFKLTLYSSFVILQCASREWDFMLCKTLSRRTLEKSEEVFTLYIFTRSEKKALQNTLDQEISSTSLQNKLKKRMKKKKKKTTKENPEN